MLCACALLDLLNFAPTTHLTKSAHYVILTLSDQVGNVVIIVYVTVTRKCSLLSRFGVEIDYSDVIRFYVLKHSFSFSTVRAYCWCARIFFLLTFRHTLDFGFCVSVGMPILCVNVCCRSFRNVKRYKSQCHTFPKRSNFAPLCVPFACRVTVYAVTVPTATSHRN